MSLRIARAAFLALTFLFLSAPSAAPAADVTHSRSVLGNGLTVVTRNAGGDLAAACLFVGAGPAYEGKDNNGITELLNRVVLACHPLAGSTPPVLRIEQLGGRVTVETSGYYSCFSLVAPSRNFGEALRVLAEALSAPDCSEATLATEKAALSARRDWLDDRLADRAFGAFMDKTYGGQPCGLDPAGTQRSLAGIRNGDVARWREMHYRPANMTLSIAANVGPEQASRLAAQAFGGLAPSGPDGDARPGAGGPCQKSASYDMACGDGGAAAVIGYSAPPPGSADYPAILLARALLSEGMGSSLFRELRGGGRSAYSFGCVMPKVAGSSRLAFYVVTDPDRVAEAAAGIRKSVEDLKAGNVTDDEVARARGLAIGGLSMRGETALDMAWNAGYHESLGLGADYPERLAQAVGRLGRGELVAAAARHLGEYTQVVLKPGKGAR